MVKSFALHGHGSLSRRELLLRVGTGFGTLALAALLDLDDLRAATGTTGSNPLAPKQPHFAAKAKRVVHLFMNGGPSQVDTFDPKPALAKYAGRPALPGGNPKTERPTGTALPSPFQFRKHGQSGMDISEIFPNLATCADDLCFIRSMHTNIPNHQPSILMMNCGDLIQSRPSLGAWVNYGLGSENQNLPGFIAMCPGGYPTSLGPRNWQAAFLPGAYQGTFINSQPPDPAKLIDNIRNERITGEGQSQQMELLRELNDLHREARPGDGQLEARIQTFELAYRMQRDATDAFDISNEPKHIQALYGEGVHARQCLMARRLLERGVRFVQLWHGPATQWDDHNDIANHRKLAKECDQGIAALLKDLKQRGMLDDTLVFCSGEFGRTPTVELPVPGQNTGVQKGRDHNHLGFTVWLAGGGVKGGHVHGATDEFGFAAVEQRVHVHDLQATILHLLGLDHERLTYRHAGRDFRLTDVHGQVVKEILA